nr:unnamed protein product [Digitaria exilis]
MDATSSPSVPGEPCESSASMQIHDSGGVDVTSAASDEVDGNHRATHGSMSQGGADAESDELEYKRRPEHPSSVHDGLMMRHLGGCGGGAPFGMPQPTRDPLAPMVNYPTYAALGGGGAVSLPSLPMPARPLGQIEGLKPLPSLLQYHQMLRHRQAMQAAGLVAPPKAEVKVDGNVAGGDAAAAALVYQQMVRSGLLPLGHKM